MGQDARWVCYTCKTVCSRGGRPLVRGMDSIEAVNQARLLIAQAREVFELDGKPEEVSSFLNDLSKWLSRHQTHNIHIGSDYSTDMMDLDDYHNESVDGKVSDCTRFEVRCKSVDEWEATARKQIEQVIRKHKDEITHGNMGTVSNELYQKFSMGRYERSNT